MAPTQALNRRDVVQSRALQSLAGFEEKFPDRNAHDCANDNRVKMRERTQPAAMLLIEKLNWEGEWRNKSRLHNWLGHTSALRPFRPRHPLGYDIVWSQAAQQSTLRRLTYPLRRE